MPDTPETAQQTTPETLDPEIAEKLARTGLTPTLFDEQTNEQLRSFGIDPLKYGALFAAAKEAARKNDEMRAQMGLPPAESEQDPDIPWRWNPKNDRPVRLFKLEPEKVRAYYEWLHSDPKRDQMLRGRHHKVQYRRPAKLAIRGVTSWPEEVTAASVLAGLVQGIRRHVAMPEDLAMLVALWVLHTHALDAFETTPRLVIRSTQPACGKTRLLALLSLLAARPLEICAASSRAILDSLGYRPTLLIDDAAAALRNAEVCAILRSGRQRSGASLLRSARRETHNLDLFTPVALAIEGKTPAMLEERSIDIRMDRIKPGETLTALRDDALKLLEELQSKAARWAADRVEQLRGLEHPSLPAADDYWTPLLIIAADAGPEWESRTRNLMQRMRAISGTPLQLLLADIRTLLEQRASGDIVLRMADGKYFADRDRIRSADLARLLAGLEGQPWCEWGKSAQPITPHALAKILSEANIRPATLRFHTADQNRTGPTITDKGYLTAQLTEAFERYLEG